jgi:hypothetical protein
MRLEGLKTYALSAGGMLVLVVAIVLATGSGSAVAAQITSVFVTNTASHPVPVNETNTDANGNIKIHEQGTANVNVLGTISARQSIPSTAFSKVVSGAFQVVSGPDPGGTHYAITSISVDNSGSSPALAELQGVYGTATPNCDFPDGFQGSRGPRLIVPGNDSRTISFPQPFVIDPQPGSNACLEPEVASTDLTVTVVGYTF